MRALAPRRAISALRFFILCATLIFGSSLAFGQAQATAADLNGVVRDPNGAAVPNATVTARNKSNNLTRTTNAGDDGSYQFTSLPPGQYEVTAEASGFGKATITDVTLTVGQSAQLDIPLKVGNVAAELTITGGDVTLVEATSTTVANTIDQQRIQNLPINERSATGFALTLSTVGRDNGRPIGPAPTSGLNIGGQRGRSTLVQVDGADFTDNSINAARTTVSQEAVQEYQVATNSYAPEFGRATGGIVNVVTKGGGNEFRGNVFGFIRHKTIQARNTFAPVIDGDPNKKPPFTRVQYGATFGGPIKQDRTFFFASVEQRRRQESGFFTGDIVGGLTQSVTIGAPFLPVSQTFTRLTPAQVTYIQAELASGSMARIGSALGFAHLASAGGQTSLNGASTLTNFLPGLGVPQGQVIGGRFILSGAPVPVTRNANGDLIAFRPLSQLLRIFPISEDTTFFSVRGDHQVNANNQLTMRFGYNPGDVSGIQDESQNQTLGQNDFSRTGIQLIRDTSFNAGLTSVLPHNLVNEAYFSFGRRKATFDSQVPSIAHQIAGTGFIGSNPFSPVDRVEKRYQFRDNLNWAVGNHTFKFGGDINFINIDASFELNFPGLFNFSQQSCSSLVTGCAAGQVFTPLQAYGLGFPSVFIQGFGNPISSIKNRPLSAFAQDTWKVRPNFTINYGVRYDIEFTDTIAPSAFTDPLTGIALSVDAVQTAQDFLNVQQGFPRDKNNFAPRLGAAWDVRGNGKTVIRGALGLFYDHPLLAVAFNSDVGDGSQQQQSTLLPVGGPSPTALFNAFQVFHGTVCNRGTATNAFCAAALAAAPAGTRTPGVAQTADYLFGQQRFDPSKFTGFGPILPFTLHVSKDFEYAYATQGNFAVEHQIGKDAALSVSYITVNARHLPHPADVNNVRTDLLIENFRRFFGGPPPSLTAAAFGVNIPSAATDSRVIACPTGVTAPLCFTNLGQPWVALVPGFLAAPVANLGNRVVSPIAANYFRKAGPNYFFVAALTGLNKATFDSLIAGSVASPGLLNPYADVNAQVSDGNSSYNALNVEFKKRLSNMQFLASYTWSHSIDDSSDLQTLLKPQDNLNFRAEKADSLFDQRHRFVFSGVWSAPDEWKSAGGFRSFLHGFVVAPIVEISSGRPFNILALGDANGDFQSTNERPSVRADGTLCAVNVDTNCPAGFPLNGSLGRNRGITHSFFETSLRVSRGIRFSERVQLNLIAEGFNLFNRFNEASANPLYSVVNAFGQRSGGKYFSTPTASFDPRQFQFGFKLGF